MSDPIEAMAQRLRDAIAATPLEQEDLRKKLEAQVERVVEMQKQTRAQIESIVATEMKNQERRQAESEELKASVRQRGEVRLATTDAFIEGFAAQNEVLAEIVRKLS